MSNRKTVSVTLEAHAALAEQKHPDESWSDVFHRAADALGEVGTDEHEPNTVVVENVGEIAVRSAEKVEERMTRR